MTAPLTPAELDALRAIPSPTVANAIERFKARRNCDGWTREAALGTVGAVWTNSPQWTNAGPAECSRVAHLICVEY